MIDEAERATGGSLLFQVALQEFAGNGPNFERPRSVMRCLRMRSPVVDAVDSFHFRRHNGRNMSRIHSVTVQVRPIGSPAWMLTGWSSVAISARASGRLIVAQGPKIWLLRWWSSLQKQIQFQHPPDLRVCKLPR